LNETQLTIDGKLGPITFTAANQCNPGSLRQALREQAQIEYRAIVAANPHLEPDLQGLLNRAAW